MNRYFPNNHTLLPGYSSAIFTLVDSDQTFSSSWYTWYGKVMLLCTRNVTVVRVATQPVNNRVIPRGAASHLAAQLDHMDEVVKCIEVMPPEVMTLQSTRVTSGNAHGYLPVNRLSYLNYVELFMGHLPTTPLALIQHFHLSHLTETLQLLKQKADDQPAGNQDWKAAEVQWGYKMHATCNVTQDHEKQSMEAQEA